MNDETLIQDSIGNKCWYKNSRLHRVNGPAVEKKNGDKEWYLNGKRHREDGPAIEFSSFEGWYFNDKEHRLNGPAKIWADGTKEWWINGQLHRLEGPAAAPNSVEELWYIRNREYKSEEHPFNIFRIEYDLPKEYEEWTNEYKVLFKMIYGGL